MNLDSLDLAKGVEGCMLNSSRVATCMLTRRGASMQQVGDIPA